MRSYLDLDDADLVRRYEAVRANPMHRDCGPLLREIEARARANGIVQNRRIKVAYRWDRESRSVVRRKRFNQEYVTAMACELRRRRAGLLIGLIAIDGTHSNR
jgi:hypothetical protein